MDGELERILATGQEGSSILARGLGLLHLVAASSGASVKELSERAELPLATVYRLVNQLREAGFVVEYDGRIHAGAAIAPVSTDAPHLVDYARPALIQAARSTGITAVLTVRVHTLALCLDVVPAGRSGAPAFRIGATRSLYAGASATPLLAFASPTVITNVLASGIKRYTADTPTAGNLPGKLAEIRQRGYGLSHGEIQPQWTALGLPVFDRGNVFCCLSLTGPTPQFANVTALLETLHKSAAHLIKRLPVSSDGLPWNPTDPT